MFRGKKYKENATLFDKSKLYDSTEAISIICQTKKANFDETVECHVRLGVDSRHADQQVRGAVGRKMSPPAPRLRFSGSRFMMLFVEPSLPAAAIVSTTPTGKAAGIVGRTLTSRPT